MKPSNDELHEIMRLAGRKICDLSIIQIGRLNTLSAMYFGYLAKAEYERQQQPASVPAELVEIFTADCEIARRHNAPSEFWGFWPALQDFANKCAAYGRRQSQKAGECCPMCGSPEVDYDGPETKYACGSSDYDQRPGTFRESERCNRIRLRIPLIPEPPTC